MAEKLAAIPPAWKKIHRGSNRAMLQAERRTLTRLRKAVAAPASHAAAVVAGSGGDDTDDTKLRALRAVKAGAEQIRTRLSAAIVVSRSDARKVALGRVGAEVALLDKQLGKLGIPKDQRPTTPAQSDSAEDVPHGDAAAGSYASAWLAATTSKLLAWADDPKGSPSALISQATREQDYRIRRTATTETATAYNDEHDEAIRTIVKASGKSERKRAAWTGALFKVWDATLDKRTCGTCEDNDGQIRLVGQSFSGGEPGAIHASCRCTSQAVFIPARFRRDEDDA